MINWVFLVMGASWWLVGAITLGVSLFRPVDPIQVLRGDMAVFGGAILVYLVLWRWSVQSKESEGDER